jgi:hypothetical protein
MQPNPRDPHVAHQVSRAAQIPERPQSTAFLFYLVIKLSGPGDNMEVTGIIFDDIDGVDGAGVDQSIENGLRDQLYRQGLFEHIGTQN